MPEDDPNARLAPCRPPVADVFPLRELAIGGPDKRGRTVTDILWAVQDFKIYKTDKGISPQFSDDPKQALQQRLDYMSLGPELADLNQQINLLKTGWGRIVSWIARKFGSSGDPRLAYYERETARGIAQALSGQPDEGRATLAGLSARISKRLGNILRVLYFSICAVATLEIAVGLALYTKTMASPETETLLGLNVFELCVAAVMGCLGALLSTAIGLRSLAIDPAATLTINITYAVQRMLVGVLGAVVLHISLKSGIVSNLLGTTASAPMETDTTYKLAFVSLLAGFSERLVPNLLDRAAETYGKDDTTASPSGSTTPAS